MGKKKNIQQNSGTQGIGDHPSTLGEGVQGMAGFQGIAENFHGHYNGMGKCNYCDYDDTGIHPPFKYTGAQGKDETPIKFIKESTAGYCQGFQGTEKYIVVPDEKFSQYGEMNEEEKRKAYDEYLKEGLEEANNYSEYCTPENKEVEYTAYLKENLERTITYQEYLKECIAKNSKYADYNDEAYLNQVKFEDYGCGPECYAPGGHLSNEVKCDYSEYVKANLAEQYKYTETSEYKNSNGEIKLIIGVPKQLDNIHPEYKDLLQELQRAKQRNEVICKEIIAKHDEYLKSTKNGK